MKTLKILEVMWFSLAFVFLSLGIFHMVTQGFNDAIGFYFIIALIAIAVGFSRRKQRIKSETKSDNKIQ